MGSIYQVGLLAGDWEVQAYNFSKAVNGELDYKVSSDFTTAKTKDMELSTEEKIKRYRYEEILLILFICASDLSQYNDDDLVFFTEDIEGRIEVLFERDYLESLNSLLKVDEAILCDFDKLRGVLISMYSSQWHNKLKEQSPELNEVNIIAQKILKAININYVEPNFFADDHLNSDWN